MNKLKRLLYLISDDKRVKDVWKEAGYDTLEEARAAIRGLVEIVIRRDGADRSGSRRRDESIRRASSMQSGGRQKAGGANRIIIHVDGASRGNPGPSAVAAVAFLPSGEILSDSSRTIGEATNNIAEYMAVLEGLTLARRLGAGDVIMRLDSELVVRQLSGQYKIKNARLRELAGRVALEEASLGSCVFEHVPREENREADRLANKCLDAD